MKKINLSLLAFSCLTMILAGCNNNSTGSSSTGSPGVVSIAGKWTLTQDHTVMGDSTKITTDTTYNYTDGGPSIHLTKDGGYATYSFDKMIDTGTYELNDHVMIYHAPSHPEMPLDFDITTLTEHKMVTVFDQDFGSYRLQETRTYVR